MSSISIKYTDIWCEILMAVDEFLGRGWKSELDRDLQLVVRPPLRAHRLIKLQCCNGLVISFTIIIA
jgi:hypothetical protein